MRIVMSEAGLQGALAAARSEARLAFGDDRVFLEKYVRKPRHVEVQVLAEACGKAIHLGERECSVQRRHQKVIEESPSTAIDTRIRSELAQAALKLVKKAGYSNAGTVEFILDEARRFYFLEVNTRLQVEHPVTEMRVGIDIVWEQIRLAHGHPLSVSQEDIQFRGHAIECRIYAEDPENGYFPSSGSIVSLNPAGGPGIREDRGVDEGSNISTYYDTMISKVIAWGSSRAEAISRLIRALDDYEIFGVKTNISLCLSVLHHPAFRAGRYDTSFLEERIPKVSPVPEHALLSAAAACVLLEQVPARKDPRQNHEVNCSEWRRQSFDWVRDEFA
jgi:acetyl-CoA carboxylase biotin carboxylase subunit